MKVSQKITLTVLLAVNLALMAATWFGGAKGIQEISGLIVLTNPINLVSVLLILLGLWLKKVEKLQYWLVYGGFMGMIAAELYEFFTWYTHTINAGFGVLKSFSMAQPLFYVGLMLTVATLTTAVLFGYVQYKQDEKNQAASS